MIPAGPRPEAPADEIAAAAHARGPARDAARPGALRRSTQDDSAAAEKALAEAERLNAQAPEIAELRQAMQAAQQKDAHRGSRVTELLTNMREAIARDDFAAADGDLNAAERINVQDPALDEARRELARARDAEEEKADK